MRTDMTAPSVPLTVYQTSAIPKPDLDETLTHSVPSSQHLEMKQRHGGAPEQSVLRKDTSLFPRCKSMTGHDVTARYLQPAASPQRVGAWA